MNKSVAISLVTTCKGRLSYLKKSLLTWLELDYSNYDIIVVDYDCPDGTEEYIRKKKTTLLKNSDCKDIRVIKVEDRPFFNLNDARNIGIHHSDAQLVFMIDSDISIKDQRLLSAVDINYREGKIFFASSPVLNSNFNEALDYYSLGFGCDVNVPAILPMRAENIGLSGTVCILRDIWQTCGQYDPKINELGYGCDDIEFYLRYLNTYLNRLLNATHYDLLSSVLDDVLARIHVFPASTFDAEDNSEDEKQQFYPMDKEQSSRQANQFINDFFQTFTVNSAEPYTPGGQSILEKNAPISPGFRCWFHYWRGVKLFDLGQWKNSEESFRKLLKLEYLPRWYRGNVQLYLGDIELNLGGDNWEQYYRRGCLILKPLSPKNERLHYRLASVYKKLGNSKAARSHFREVLAQTSSPTLISGVYFHMGEIFSSAGQPEKANYYFNRCLQINPGHRKAAQYFDEKSTKKGDEAMSHTAKEHGARVCAVICNWNKKDYVVNCVASVKQSTHKKLDIVVVDNASTDGSVKALKRRYGAIVIHIIENSQNLGGTGGFNTGLRYALEVNNYDYVWLLDNDVTVAPDALQKLLDTMIAVPEAGIVGSVILYMDEPETVHELGGFVDKERFVLPLNYHRVNVSQLPEKHEEVDYVPACSILVDVEKMMKVGIMDEGFFLYYDEVEWCSRFQSKGYKILSTPASHIWHKGGAGNRSNNLPIYFQWRNKFYFFMRTLKGENLRHAFIDTYFQELFTAMYTSRLMGKFNAYQTFVWILTDILRGIRGKPPDNRMLPRDDTTFGTFYDNDGFAPFLQSGIRNMIVLDTRMMFPAPLETFIKKHLPEDGTLTRITGRTSSLPSIGKNDLVVVACNHVLMEPNPLEGLLLSDQAVFLDSYSNFIPGRGRVNDERKKFKEAFEAAVRYYKPVLEDLL